MAIEPKSPRKRAVKKVSKKKSLAADSSTETVDTSVAEATESKSKKRAPAIPVPIFQAATTEKAPKAARKSAVKGAAAKNATDAAAPADAATPADDEDSRGGRNRRRRRGGRGRRKPSIDGVDSSELNEDGDEPSSEATAVNVADALIVQIIVASIVSRIAAAGQLSQMGNFLPVAKMLTVRCWFAKLVIEFK
jgi:ribonuclease E